ncbi:winged helix DNA-binding domain-containing protein [Rothia nasisuis]|uniref:winged helix DNA-binding domain-containing protein n=1 Tax=Rothia nasisuis TaxID=2109647 RepID=UPI00235150CF|nr:winged helix DNA-binding domain-containing protein [Rothia nasisuis]
MKRLVTDLERRARIGVRHALARTARVASPEEATRAVVCLHATDPPSVHLSCWARIDEVSVDDVERALYETRSLVRQQSMRETIFVFPRDLVPAVWGSAAARIAMVYRKRFIKDLQRWGSVPEGEGAARLASAERAVLGHLADGVARSSAQVREEVPEASGFLVQAPDKAWGGKQAIAPKVLTQLSLDGVVARAGNAGVWYTSRPTWTTTKAWWGHDVPEALEAREGYAELVHRWLWSYGPGTLEDIAWWLGNTKTTVRTALDDLNAVPVSLEDGRVGWLRQDDVEPVTSPEPWVALLPLLDPTVMGWKERDFFLGKHGPQLFDSAGNAGTTVWVDGRVVGVWVQDGDGVVQVRLLEHVDPAIHQVLHAEARRLTEWLDGQRVFTVYPSPAMQRPD